MPRLTAWRCLILVKQIKFSATTPAAWRYSPRSFALHRASERSPNWSRNFTAKLFDEGVGHRRVRKTPAIICLAFLQNYMAVSRLDVSRIVKVHDPPV